MNFDLIFQSFSENFKFGYGLSIVEHQENGSNENKEMNKPEIEAESLSHSQVSQVQDANENKDTDESEIEAGSTAHSQKYQLNRKKSKKLYLVNNCVKKKKGKQSIIKAVKCDECDIILSGKKNLTRHKRIHTVFATELAHKNVIWKDILKLMFFFFMQYF
ncbi:hypothetical protein RFI_25171 [Reticulomyxa filosa]|uniref:C2H2-type domain-containing protein n=1 Tax=Reticulomyxa filosa TaxID=46433 RepID=X6MDV9_RETFI|nr:hypothetical protein RFI_25171 [Reticulomyxa filosa]|eukprot:ETO12203.1 hypothetical protein RFI_25171 [Reticulomyxa filosa]